MNRFTRKRRTLPHMLCTLLAGLWLAQALACPAFAAPAASGTLPTGEPAPTAGRSSATATQYEIGPTPTVRAYPPGAAAATGAASASGTAAAATEAVPVPGGSSAVEGAATETVPASAESPESSATAALSTTRASGSGTLRVGWFIQPGYMETDSNGQESGYIYEYLQSIAQQTGWTYTFVAGDYYELYYKLRKGDIDLMGLMFVDENHSGQVIISNLAAGVNHTTLFTRVDSPLGENDYAAFNGIRVGVMQASSDEAAFLDLSMGKGFTPRLMYYSSQEAIERAVRTGVIDAGVTGAYRSADNLRQLARFAPRNFYFAVSTQKPEVARKLNDAMAEIQASDKSFHDKLAEKYQYESSEYFTLTSEEKEYLSAQTSLTVAYGKQWEPLLQLSARNEPSGVSVRILNHLRELTGITLTYVPLETTSQYDILCSLPQDYALASAAGVRLSNSFLTMPMALITRDADAAVDAVAVDGGYHMNGVRSWVPYRLVYYSGARECLDAVLDGSQPAALLNSYAADNLLQSTRYAALTSRRMEGVSVSACFGVLKTADPRLLSILNKLVNHISTSEMNDYIISSILENQSITLSAIADRMPVDVTAVAFSVAVLLVALSALLIVRGVRIRQERAHVAEIAAFLDYANKANDDVWEVNVATRKRWRYRVEKNNVVRVPITTLTPEQIGRYVYPDDLPTVQEHMQKALTAAFVENQQQDRFECRLLYGEAYRWSRIVFQSMLQSPRHPNCIMVYIMDVDEAMRAEERKNRELQDALAMAERASSAKGEFTAYISHEIRSPLNAVLGYLALAKSSVGDPERLQDCFVKSEYAANHLLGLVNDVLDMGSIASGRLQLACDTFDVQALMDTLASIYNAQAKARGIRYTVETGNLPQRYLIGDDLRIKQVIVNLLSNAMKFTPRDGCVTLSAEQLPQGDGVRMRFCVSDTGIGMSDVFQKQLFSAFVQQDASIAGHFGGSGLGLNIAKNLLSLMGGDIAVQSAPGRGTTFTVEIPLPIDAGKRNLAQAQPDSRTSFAGRRLLLVEDNDMNMEIATELLKQEGSFAIESATNGREAVDKFTQSPAGTFDAILMDVRMPVMDGYEATRAIRRSSHPDAQRVPIVAMTANAFAEDVRLAMEAGMNGHIPKPIDIRRVLLTLSALLPE